MEAVIELDRQYGLDSEAKDTSEAWITALSAFNTANAEVFDFVDRFGLENKTNFLLILTKRIISDVLSPQGSPSLLLISVPRNATTIIKEKRG